MSSRLLFVALTLIGSSPLLGSVRPSQASDNWIFCHALMSFVGSASHGAPDLLRHPSSKWLSSRRDPPSERKPIEAYIPPSLMVEAQGWHEQIRKLAENRITRSVINDLIEDLNPPMGTYDILALLEAHIRAHSIESEPYRSSLTSVQHYRRLMYGHDRPKSSIFVPDLYFSSKNTGTSRGTNLAAPGRDEDAGGYGSIARRALEDGDGD